MPLIRIKKKKKGKKKENERTRGLILHKWIDTRKTCNEVFIASSTYVHLSYRIGEICNKSARAGGGGLVATIYRRDFD